MGGFKEHGAAGVVLPAGSISATYSATDLAITNMFQQAAGPVTSSVMLASRSASCRSHNQNIQAVRCVVNGVSRERTLPDARNTSPPRIRPHTSLMT
jgi:hypothetical protein